MSSRVDVCLLWALKNRGWTTVRCARHFGVSASTASAIIRRTHDEFGGVVQSRRVESAAAKIMEAAHV